MCFVFALCSPPLSLRFARTGAFTGVLLSIVVVFVGWNTLLLMKGVALGRAYLAALAALSTPILFTCLGAWLLRGKSRMLVFARSACRVPVVRPEAGIAPPAPNAGGAGVFANVSRRCQVVPILEMEPEAR
jgi:hypothetical protein